MALRVCGDKDIHVPDCEEEKCDLVPLSITENGVYVTTEHDGYSSVEVDVPNSYTESDEGKVVSNGALVTQGSQTIAQNGTYDTTLISELIANISGGGGGQFPFVDEAYNSNYSVGVAIVTPDLANLDAFNENYAQTKAIFVGRKKTLDSTDVGETLSQYIQSASIEPTSLEYYGNVYGNSSMISDLGLVLLGDFSQGGSTTGNVLADSIDNYTAVILQGIYQKQRTSNYNTSMLYTSPLLNTAYWAGMKDRNSNYDCNVTFTDDTTVSLSGNRQVIIYGML